MPPLLKETRAGLLRRRNALLDELDKREPALAAELRAVLLKLDQPELKAGEYATVKTPLKAILKYLEDCGEWSNKDKMRRAILDGGYGRNPMRDFGYLEEAIDRAVDGNKLQMSGDLVGLPGWPMPSA